MQIKNKLITASIFIIGIVIGLLSCIIIKKFTIFDLDTNIGFEINPFELPVLIINLILALYITSTLAKNLDSKKSEKELIINNFVSYKLWFAEEISKLLTNNNFDDPTSKSKFKILRKKFFSLIEVSRKSTLTINKENLNEVQKLITDLWQIFTDTPPAPNSKASKANKDAVNTLQLEKKGEIEILVISIEQKIEEEIININNCN